MTVALKSRDRVLIDLYNVFVPKKPFVVFRRLTEEQLGHLSTRRAPKKYIPTTAPGRGGK